MNGKNALESFSLLVVSALMAGQASHWFVSGQATGHSTARNLAVVGQLLVGVGLMIYGWSKLRRGRRSRGSIQRGI